MQRSSRAPVLSATRRRDSCWITGHLPWGWRGPSLLGGLHDFHEPPVLRLRERARLDDADDVADVRCVALVVRVELRRAADDLLVSGMRLDRLDTDDDRLVHRIGDDDAAALLAAAARVLGLRQPHDRLPLGRAGTRR